VKYDLRVLNAQSEGGLRMNFYLIAPRYLFRISLQERKLKFLFTSGRKDGERFIA